MQLEQYIIDATLEVFASMIFIDIGPEALRNDEAEDIQVNLASMIGLAGDLKGILTVQCPAAVAMGITSAMLGMEVTGLDEDARDAIGEITNMVAGGLKVALAAHSRKIELAIPSTVVGSSLRSGRLAGATRVFIPFSLPIGRFGIELKYVLA